MRSEGADGSGARQNAPAPFQDAELRPPPPMAPLPQSGSESLGQHAWARALAQMVDDAKNRTALCELSDEDDDAEEFWRGFDADGRRLAFHSKEQLLSPS